MFAMFDFYWWREQKEMCRMINCTLINLNWPLLAVSSTRTLVLGGILIGGTVSKNSSKHSFLGSGLLVWETVDCMQIWLTFWKVIPLHQTSDTGKIRMLVYFFSHPCSMNFYCKGSLTYNMRFLC
jgi:hypothetical protein